MTHQLRRPPWNPYLLVPLLLLVALVGTAVFVRVRGHSPSDSAGNPTAAPPRTQVASAGSDSVKRSLKAEGDDPWSEPQSGGWESRFPAEELDRIQAQLGEVDSALSANGFVQYRGISFNMLKPRHLLAFEMPLPPGKYLMVGACDQQCDDLGIQLTHESATRVQADSLTHATMPALSFVVTRADTIRGEVRMEACRAVGCVYGVLLARER